MLINKCTWTSSSSLGGEICFKGGAVPIPLSITALLWQMMPLYPGCGTGPTHCNCRICPGEAWTHRHWEHCMVLIPMSWRYFCGVKSQWVTNSNHTFFIFFLYQVGILLFSFKQTLEWLFQWWDGPWCHTAAQISANLIRLLQSNGISLSLLCTRENEGRENLYNLSKSVH